MSTTEKSLVEAAFEAVLKKETLDPEVEKKIHEEAAKVRAKMLDTEAQDELRRFRDGDE